MTLIDDKIDSIQDHCAMYRDYCIGILQWGREIELNSEYSMCKWVIIAKEQSGESVNGKLLREDQE